MIQGPPQQTQARTDIVCEACRKIWKVIVLEAAVSQDQKQHNRKALCNTGNQVAQLSDRQTFGSSRHLRKWEFNPQFSSLQGPGVKTGLQETVAEVLMHAHNA